MKKRVVAKVVAMMLCLCMVASVFTGCQNTEKPAETSATEKKETQGATEPAGGETETEPEEEITADYFAGTELTIAIVAKAADQSTDFNEKAISKLLEEQTGIHINWIVIDEGVKAERKSVLLASDDQPDAYISLITPDDIINNPELFYDLSEDGLLEKWAPDLYQEYAVDHPSVINALTWSDGSIYSLPIDSYASDTNGWLYSFPSINTEWLEKIGKDIPTTADELYEVLVLFRDNDMNGNGDTTDEIPFTFVMNNWKASLGFMAQMWGLGAYGQSQLGLARGLKDGEVVSTIDTENFRDYLEFMHKLYEEDLLDKEGFTQTEEQYNAKQAAETPVVGVCSTWSNDSFKKEQGVYQFFYFQGMEGVDPVLLGCENKNPLSEWSAFGFVPTADTNIEALLHWWNYMGSTEENKLIAHGLVEGINYEVLDDGVVQRLASPPQDDPNYVDYWTNGLANNRMPDDPDKQVRVPYEGFNLERAEFTELVVENGLTIPENEFWVYHVAPAEETAEKSFIELELKEYIDNFHAEAIMNGVTDDSWNAHLEQLEAIGYYEWLQYWDNYYTNNWE